MGCHALLQGIFPTQELNSGPLQGRQILYCLSHQEALSFHETWIQRQEDSFLTISGWATTSEKHLPRHCKPLAIIWKNHLLHGQSSCPHTDTKSPISHHPLLFSHQALSDSSQPHGLQHVRLPSASPRVCPSSCLLHHDHQYLVQKKFPIALSSLRSVSARFHTVRHGKLARAEFEAVLSTLPDCPGNYYLLLV